MQMREIIAEKLGEDQITHAKNKEKNIALFNEVVRIGQDLEKFSSQLQQVSMTMDVKLQTFETKIIKNEQDLSDVEHLRNMFSGNLAGVAEKTETRLNQLENSISLLISDNKITKESMRRVETVSVKGLDDLKSLYFEVQKDFMSKYFLCISIILKA